MKKALELQPLINYVERTMQDLDDEMRIEVMAEFKRYREGKSTKSWKEAIKEAIFRECLKSEGSY